MKKTKLSLGFHIIIYILFSSEVFSIERSVVPLIEQFECIENLSPEKYPKELLIEIESALAHKENKVRVASYNMLFDLNDHRLEEDNRWPQRLPRIVELIGSMQPDLIGIQELQKNQVDDLLGFIGHTFGFYATPFDAGEQNGILYRKSRFDVLDRQIIFMTSTPSIPSKEAVTILKLKDKQTDQVFAIINTHLAYSNVEKRAFQARFLAGLIHPLLGHLPILLTGDFNTFPHRLELSLPFYDGDYIHRLLTTANFQQARERAVLGHVGPLSTFTNTESDGGTPFKGTGTPGVFLDHIYVSSEIKVLIHAVEPATVEGHFPSDHMPVVSDFYIDLPSP